jgi:hypothetical protein
MTQFFNFQNDSPNFHANPCSTEFLRRFDGIKMGEKDTNKVGGKGGGWNLKICIILAGNVPILSRKG